MLKQISIVSLHSLLWIFAILLEMVGYVGKRWWWWRYPVIRPSLETKQASFSPHGRDLAWVVVTRLPSLMGQPGWLEHNNNNDGSPMQEAGRQGVGSGNMICKFNCLGLLKEPTLLLLTSAWCFHNWWEKLFLVPTLMINLMTHWILI